MNALAAAPVTGAGVPAPDTSSSSKLMPWYGSTVRAGISSPYGVRISSSLGMQVAFVPEDGGFVIHNGYMSTPSERIWASGDEPTDGSSPAAFLPARARHPVTLAETAHRIGGGTTLREAVADFLDNIRFARDDDDAAGRIREEPPTVDPRTDAYLAAVAEHVAISRGLRAPPWTRGPARFLDHFWWPSATPALHARALVESPAAFRRRGIFIGRTTLQRV